jgi:trk system potassium uptake protein TrkA
MQRRNAVVIVGAGRVGGSLAGRLSHVGRDVIVVDRSDAALAALPSEFSGFRLRGNASEMQTLRQAKLDEAEWLFAVTDRDDLNLMVAIAAARAFDVPNVCVCVRDASHQALFEGLELRTINPNQLAVEALADLAGVAS